MRRGVLAALAALAVLASAVASAQAAAYFEVGKLPLPNVTGKEIADSLASYSTTYSPRVTGTPGEQAAGEFLRAEAEKLGYQTEVKTFPLAGPEPGAVPRAVIATKKGITKPDEHILFMGHYDTVSGVGGVTLDGAYDNGSGTMMIRALARAFAAVPTNRTIDFIWYNGEEEGLIASQRHAAQAKAEGMKVRAALGFDMVGIAYPVAQPGERSCLCMWHGGDDEILGDLLAHINFNVLGFPDVENLVHIVGANERNSDESSWDAQGYPTMRWAGRRAAADYPAYHMPDDTMATIDREAGGRAFFEQGLRNTLVSAYLSALAMDNEMPVAHATAAVNGASVTYEAGGSTDPDGHPGGVNWDFGDGTHGIGARASHAYAHAGDYVARASVSDNLWSQVTATQTVAVHVPKGTAKPAAKRKHSKRKASCVTRKQRRTKACRKLRRARSHRH